MRLVVWGAISCLLLTGGLVEAHAASRQKSRAQVLRGQDTTYDRRPTTVAANGLCQRDTGKPDSQIDFRNRCDTEEFWARIQSRGGRR